MYVDALEEIDVKVLECGSISDAEKIFQDTPDLNLALLDYYTPGSDYAFTHQEGTLLSQFIARKGFQFYFVTGSVELTENSVKELGASGLLRKPFMIDDLQELVKKSLLSLND